VEQPSYYILYLLCRQLRSRTEVNYCESSPTAPRQYKCKMPPVLSPEDQWSAFAAAGNLNAAADKFKSATDMLVENGITPSVLVTMPDQFKQEDLIEMGVDKYVAKMLIGR
jgi:hypothetical protein